MKKNGQTKIANIIKKWLITVEELQSSRFAIAITRLVSIKSLCSDQSATRKFGLYIAKRVQEKMNEESCPENFSSEEWELDQTIVAEAIALMEKQTQESTLENTEEIYKILKKIKDLQGDDIRRVHWTTIHFVRSGNLLKIDYALRCFLKSDFEFWAYKLARECTEEYEPLSGTGLIPKSIPMLLEIAEFWCQHYFGQSLSEKFPQFNFDQ